MKKILAGMLALSMVFTLAACGGQGSAPANSGTPAVSGSGSNTNEPAAQKTTLQIGFTTAADPSDPYFYVATEMARILEEKSGGTMGLELFPNGQLGQEREMFEGMQMGTTEMAVMTNSYVSNFIPACGALDLPFIFEDVDQAVSVMSGSFGQSLFTEFEGSGVVPLAWAVGGFRNLVTVGNAVKTPEDFKGMKIRCLENNTYMNTYSTLGANPTPMAWSETIPGLQQKTVQGLDASISVLYTGGFADICDYLSLTNQFFAATLVCISQTEWDKLTAEQQTWLRESAQEASVLQAQFQVQADEDNLTKMEEAGIEVIRDVDYAAFKEALGDFYDSMKESIGAQYVDDLFAAIG